MSTQFEGVFDSDKDWDKTLIINAHLEAKDDSAADEVEKLLKAIAANAQSSAEPGCIFYHVARAGKLFAVFEKYTGAEAVKQHFASEQFQAFGNVTNDVLVKAPSILFYKEI